MENPLHDTCPIPGARGRVPPVGPADAALAFLGEAAGKQEVYQSEPFVGPSGDEFNRWLMRIGVDRSQVRIGNVIECHPPRDWLVGAPWEQSALDHCRPQLEEFLAGQQKVLVTLGGSALRSVLGLPRARSSRKSEGGIRLLEFHGAPMRSADDRYWIVPTFHPAFLQRNNQKLLKTVIHDLQVAKELVAGTYELDMPQLIVDPDPGWFERWVDDALLNPTWLAVDIETPDKESKVDEGDLGKEDVSYEILCVNLSKSTGEGVTVPWYGPYITLLKRLLENVPGQVYWNCPTPDQKVLTDDLRWVEAGDLKVGDRLVGFDEDVQAGRRARRYKTSEVTHAGRALRRVMQVNLSDGTAVKVTDEHPWLIAAPVGKNKRTKAWVATKNLRPGWKLQRLFSPWQVGETRSHGYLAGFFDGEGHYSRQPATGTLTVAAAQKFGPTYDYAKGLLEGFSSRFKFAEYGWAREKDKNIGCLRINGRTADVARFLGEVRPGRLLAKFRPEDLGAIQSRRDQDVFISSVEDLGEQEIVTLSTSASTYILEGFGAHNSLYDVPRLKKAGINVEWAWAYDFMNAWHVLHSSLPKGLGFVAPFYSRTGPWKHLGSRNATYRALDGVQTLRCAYGIMQDLQSTGMWEVFQRHNHELDTYVLRPAEAVGLPFNRGKLEAYGAMLEQEEKRLEAEITVPDKIRKLSRVYPRMPKVKPGEDLVEVPIKVEVQECLACGKKVQPRAIAGHPKSCSARSHMIPEGKRQWRCAWCSALGKKVHVCPNHPGTAGRTLDQLGYQKRLPFNPRSWQQVMEYIRGTGASPGRNRKTGKDTTDKKTINRLAKKGDPFYVMLKEYRGVTKMRGTYADPILKRLDSDNRLHGTFAHGPSTMRLNSRDPNLQNLAHHVAYASDFRRCVEASPGSIFVTADFAAIEAVLTGYFMGDPEYIRVAKLGVHARLASHILGTPADMSQSDEALRAFFKKLKDEQEKVYNQAKRTVHGYNYGLTAYGLQDQFPDLFPTRKDAQQIIAVYEAMVPSLKRWQTNLRKQAHATGVIGPQGHPFKYRHHFFGVVNFRKSMGQWKEYLGDDAKRVVAFLPQSVAGGVLYEACLRLAPQVEKLWQGRTAFRALIHDEIFLEVDEDKKDEAIRLLVTEMSRPVVQLPCPREWGVGSHLQIGVSVKVGKNWADVDPKKKWSQDGNPEGMKEVDDVNSIAADAFRPEEEEEEAADYTAA